MAEVARRRFLAGTAAAGMAAVVMDPMGFAQGAAGSEQTKTLTGHIDYGAPDWVYVPVDVPDGVNRITVSYGYERPAPPEGQNGNALDIGVFDESGHQLGNERGFRGWSGGARTSFTISASDATPGYIPGPVKRGRWNVILGPYTVHPQGLNWTITVKLEFGPDGAPFKPNPAPHSAKGRGRAWYRGDMHLHTIHSDGGRTPAELAAGARAAKLDYIVSTEHNTQSASGVWGEYAGDDLLIIDGEEVTTRNGHYGAYGLRPGSWIDWRYRAVDGGLPRFVQEIHRAGGLAIANHPAGSCVGCSWKFGYAGMDAVEVWNGPWDNEDVAVLQDWDNLLAAQARSGRWLPAVGNSDAHREPNVIGLPHNVVYADRLERGAILAGVKAGRLWIAESAAVDLSFTASGAGRKADIGQRLEAAEDAPVTLSMTVNGAGGCEARFYTDQGQRFSAKLPAEGAGTVTWQTNARNATYVRAEVRRLQATATTPNAMVALTNPIFLGHRSR
ncbi:PHP domain-containing protein [Actinomadura barringtoniae]|uniref:PHP domain-containing protein n=1 Tax=Actinomadura barringtoniae TaxID=1427535 RepID=A0A939PQN5_9ACTN|nr:CehA/McbA family metallohydrolase [Actinomadura barringtoniae]MBO2454394.1 PHP domain-containing protein [Actinomadura barringtoniae]